jgi:hypothetical protein
VPVRNNKGTTRHSRRGFSPREESFTACRTRKGNAVQDPPAERRKSDRAAAFSRARWFFRQSARPARRRARKKFPARARQGCGLGPAYLTEVCFGTLTWRNSGYGNCAVAFLEGGNSEKRSLLNGAVEPQLKERRKFHWRRLSSLCGNCKARTSAAKAAMILQVFCRGSSHDPQRFSGSRTETVTLLFGSKRDKIFFRHRTSTTKSEATVLRLCGGGNDGIWI